MTARKTKTAKLVTLLESGREFNAVQLARRTGLKNVSATIDRLRNQQDYSIKTTVGSDGAVYRLGR
jgi:hypothetical protein